MSKIFIPVMVFISFLVTSVSAHASADDLIFLLNEICMKTGADFPSAEKIVIERGGIKDPEKHDAVQSSFMLGYAKNKYFIQASKYEKEGVCSVTALYKIDPKQIADILQENAHLSEPEDGSSDVNEVTVWKIGSRPWGEKKSPYLIGTILLRVGKEKSIIPGIPELVFVTSEAIYRVKR
ncbi:hypothetical protein [Verminephrobacter aporrectodeae]|uniref:hypothetical protein n=2 Tax=Verminephrobacter aporrectodeae TaxID=1110389 RepID=UPI002237B044|nr:hypothetical protein [Verminephrobacter aporrectodeae]